MSDQVSQHAAPIICSCETVPLKFAPVYVTVPRGCDGSSTRWTRLLLLKLKYKNENFNAACCGKVREEVVCDFVLYQFKGYYIVKCNRNTP